jgi:hydrogenase nickel incorporation protein HypA/HybF
MHELPVTQSILDIVLRHAEANQVERIRTIHLRIGALADLEPEWIQSYFDLLSEGTLAQGAQLQLQRSPLTFHCDKCGTDFTADRDDLGTAQCPGCGSREASITSGTGYLVDSMEVE